MLLLQGIEKQVGILRHKATAQLRLHRHRADCLVIVVEPPSVGGLAVAHVVAVGSGLGARVDAHSVQLVPDLLLHFRVELGLHREGVEVERRGDADGHCVLESRLEIAVVRVAHQLAHQHLWRSGQQRQPLPGGKGRRPTALPLPAGGAGEHVSCLERLHLPKHLQAVVQFEPRGEGGEGNGQVEDGEVLGAEGELLAVLALARLNELPQEQLVDHRRAALGVHLPPSLRQCPQGLAERLNVLRLGFVELRDSTLPAPLRVSAGRWSRCGVLLEGSVEVVEQTEQQFGGVLLGLVGGAGRVDHQVGGHLREGGEDV